MPNKFLDGIDLTGKRAINAATPVDDNDLTTKAYVSSQIQAAGGLDVEGVQDAVGGMVTSNTETGIAVTYDDTAGKLNFAVSDSPTVGGFTPANLRDRSTHTGTQLATTISDFAEAAQDAVGTILTDSATLDFTYNDAGGTITATVLDSPTVGGATPAQLRDRSTHTGTQSADTLTDGTTNKAFLATERTKLTGIATGATANSSDATLLSRANHTGTQAHTTITLATTARLLGRTTAGAGAAEEVSVTGGIEFSGTTLRTSAFTGDVTKTAGGTALTIANSVVTNAKMANMAQSTIKGRATASTGAPEDLTGAQVKSILAITSSDISDFATAAVAAANAGTIDADTLNGSTAAQIQTAVTAAIVDTAPGTLDTLNELAAALGDDPNFATTINTSLAARVQRYATTIGDGVATTYTVTHNLGSRDVIVQVYEAGDDYEQVWTPVSRATTNTVTLTFGTAPTAGQYRVVVQGRAD